MKIGDTIYFYSNRYPEGGIYTFTIDNLLYQRRENEEEELIAIESYYNMEQWSKNDNWMKSYYLCKSGGYESQEPLYYESCTLGTFYWSYDKDCIERNFKKSLEYRIKDLRKWLKEAEEQLNDDF
jgi:hypothetical protein